MDHHIDLEVPGLLDHAEAANCSFDQEVHHSHLVHPVVEGTAGVVAAHRSRPEEVLRNHLVVEVEDIGVIDRAIGLGRTERETSMTGYCGSLDHIGQRHANPADCILR